MITNVLHSNLEGLNIRACFATDLWLYATLKKLTKYEKHSYFHIRGYILNTFFAMKVVPYWNIIDVLLNSSTESRRKNGRRLDGCCSFC